MTFEFLWIRKLADTWDEAKRRATLDARGLDFADCEAVFTGRRDYGERRFITAGYLGDRFVVLVWTPRDGGRRIISVRHGHEWEEARFRDHLA